MCASRDCTVLPWFPFLYCTVPVLYSTATTVATACHVDVCFATHMTKGHWTGMCFLSGPSFSRLVSCVSNVIVCSHAMQPF